MAPTQLSGADPDAYSRCKARSRLSLDEQNVDQKAEKADASIAEKVDRALWNDKVLRSTDYREIEVAVKDRIVFLGGHVISSGSQQRAESAASSVPGVLGITSNLVADDKLTREVAGALGTVEHSYGVKFFTGVRSGVVSLNGVVGNVTVQTMAEKCAANVPGVRGVINSLRSSEVDLRKENQRFLQPAVGERMYFRDGLSAIVQKVIINPNNRRVIAMVLLGRYSTSQLDPRFLSYGEDQVPERLVVISISAIRYLTKSSGHLHINCAEAAGASDFDPSWFRAPSEDWTPPYPYCPEDVLFPLELIEEMSHDELEAPDLLLRLPQALPSIY